MYRITPACAGKTYELYPIIKLTEDHPRVCGKNRAPELVGNPDKGSPPRVREKPVLIVLITVISGITPACAGKTAKDARRKPSVKDHPRVCGKNP